jgi:drug/metabolite transporter (DMT)-like permease
VVLGVLLLGERLGRPRTIALGLGLAGATIIVCNGIPFVNVTYAPHLVGDLLLVAHGAAWGIYTIAAKRLLDRHDPLAVSAASLAIALPFVLPLAVLEARTFAWNRSARRARRRRPPGSSSPLA